MSEEERDLIEALARIKETIDQFDEGAITAEDCMLWIAYKAQPFWQKEASK